MYTDTKCTNRYNYMHTKMYDLEYMCMYTRCTVDDLIIII